MADLGALYFMMEEHAKAQGYSEQSLAIIKQLKSKPTQESLGPIEYARARSLHTLGQIDLSNGNHAEALNKLREALALLDRLNARGSSYSIPIAEVLITVAKVHAEMGEYAHALSSLSKAHQASRSSEDQKHASKHHEQTGLCFSWTGGLCRSAGVLQRKSCDLPVARKAREEVRVLLNLAVLEQRQGRDDHALKLFDRTLESAKAAKLVETKRKTTLYYMRVKLQTCISMQIWLCFPRAKPVTAGLVQAKV